MLCWGARGGLVMTDPFHHYHRPGPRRTWGLFSLVCEPFLLYILIFVWVLSKCISSFIFPIGRVCCWLFVAMSSQILVWVLTWGFGFSIQTCVFFMRIWMSWQWLDRIMIFWFVLVWSLWSPPSLRAPYPSLWLPQQRLRNSSPAWCPGYGSVC